MRRSSDTTEEANVLQKLSIEAACPLPAAVTGGSIGRHARRNYGGPGIKEATGTAAAAQSSGDPAGEATRSDQSPLWGGSGGEDGRTSGCSGRAVFGLSCSASSASLVQVQAMSVRIERTLKVGARSAICRHSTARCLHSTGVIIDTQPNAHELFIATIQQLQPVFSGWPPALRNYLQVLSTAKRRRSCRKFHFKGTVSRPDSPSRPSTGTTQQRNEFIEFYQRHLAPALRTRQAAQWRRHDRGGGNEVLRTRCGGCTLQGEEPAYL